MRETQDGFPVLSLNDESWRILRGERAVQMAESAPPARERKRGKQSIPTTRSQRSDDEPLFESLRALRKRLADEAGVPPYVIFHDASLREMAERKPATLDEFASIPGVGQAKLDRYGNTFIAAIKQIADS